MHVNCTTNNYTICMCAPICVYICICMCGVLVHVHVHIMQFCMYACMFVCMLHVHVFACSHIFSQSAYAHMCHKCEKARHADS